MGAFGGAAAAAVGVAPTKILVLVSGLCNRKVCRRFDSPGSGHVNTLASHDNDPLVMNHEMDRARPFFAWSSYASGRF